jgi:hypothetical protein
VVSCMTRSSAFSVTLAVVLGFSIALCQDSSVLLKQANDAFKAEGRRTYSFAISKTKHLRFRPVIKRVPGLRADGSKIPGEDIFFFDQINVYSRTQAAPIQILEDCKGDQPPPANGDPLLESEDLNFDGYNDLLMLQSYGATGNSWYCVWLFDPGSDRFVYRKYWALGTHGIDTVHKRIIETGNGGGDNYTISTIASIENKPVIVGEEVHSWDPKRCANLTIFRRRVGGTLKDVKKEYRPALDTPCPKR